MLWVHLYFLVPSWIYLRFQNSSLITSPICITSYARCLGFFQKNIVSLSKTWCVYAREALLTFTCLFVSVCHLVFLQIMFLCASVITLVKLMYKASHQCAPSCEFAMHQRKFNCNVCSCVAFLLYAYSSCAFLEYLITCFLMLRYACIADNGLEFPLCVSKCAFSH